MKTLSLLVSLTVVASATAQTPIPPAQLAKFDRLIGSWQGEGTVEMEPGQPRTGWTSTSQIQKILGGMFIQDRTTITFEGMPGPLQFITTIGYDGESKQFKQWSVSNMGETQESEIYFLDDDTYVSCFAGMAMGSPQVARWITTLGDDEHVFRGEQAVGAGEWSLHVDGKLTPAKAVEASAQKDVAFMIQGASEPMQKYHRMAGTYDVKGWMAMPDGSKMDITGTQSMKPIYGGTIMEFHTVGQPNYEAWAWVGWNDHKQCYVMCSVTSMGEGASIDQRFVGNDVVAGLTGTRFGQPFAMSSVSRCNDAGAVTKVWSHWIQGAGDPMKMFEAKYTKQ